MQVQIRTVEAGLHDVRLVDGKRLGNVQGHLGCCRSGERQDARHLELGRQRCDSQVVGAKVMPPLTDAVRFVHRQHRHLDPLQ